MFGISTGFGDDESATRCEEAVLEANPDGTVVNKNSGNMDQFEFWSYR